MIHDATWFFELDSARFKKVILKAAGDKTTISVLIYDDLGMALTETETTLDLGDAFGCDVTTTGVSFTAKGQRFDF
ncbi:hypothetical protein SAMN05421890_4874 [Ensifer adhaerens]|nr:hypothetical protein SAMN05421890_4874 [Ensifer adhaerens]